MPPFPIGGAYGPWPRRSRSRNPRVEPRIPGRRPVCHWVHLPMWRHALPTDAHRGRVARAARLRHDHQQPVGELGRRSAARRSRPRSDLDVERRCCSATATTSAIRCCATRSPPAATGSRADDVLVTPGAAAALFATATVAARAGRPRRGRAHQLRDQPRDAARDRRRRSTSSISRSTTAWQLDVGAHRGARPPGRRRA